ncbi:MAG: DNA polymerase I [Thermoguttaceae bacterium]
MAKRARQQSLFGPPDDAPMDPPSMAGERPNTVPWTETDQAGSESSGPEDGLAGEPPPAAEEDDLALTDVYRGPAEPPPESLAGKTVYVVDAHSLIYQVFHALPELSSPRGEPVGAVYGFARDVLYLLEEKQPDYLFCAFDMPGTTFRHQMYEAYKEHRPPMPDDLRPQILSIRRVIDAMGVPALGCEGYEADDLLATIARVTDELGGECRLVTGDKDCRQLITDRVKMYNIRKDQVLDRQSLQTEWGIAPEQVVDFQALVGDSTDNVPGVPGIGPKTAQELLERYGTLDAIFEHAGEIKQAKRRQSLVENQSTARLSRELVKLNAAVPCAVPWQLGRVGRLDRQRLATLFRDFGFRSMASKADAMPHRPAFEPEQNPPPRGKTNIIETREALAELVEQVRRHKSIAFDLETKFSVTPPDNSMVWPRWAEIVGYSLAWGPDDGWYIPVCGPAGECCLDPRETLETLRPVLEDPAIEKFGQNLKYDRIVLRGAGVELAGVTFDTMVASYLLDAGARNHSLDDLGQRYLGRGKTSITQLIGSGKNQKRMDEVPVAQVADYACDDAVLPMRLRPILARRLDEAGLTPLFTDVEMPLIEVLAELEYNGIKIDCERLAELSRRFGERIEAVEREIYQLAGREFNIGSPKQLQQVLFVEQKLPVVSKTKTGPSTDADVLQELAHQHPLPEKILEYRQFSKLKGTYVDALPQMVHPLTGRVHASFHQAVAATGRLSSSDPNLQNIPVRSEAGREIRSAFTPGEAGWVLLAADYSQIELRVLAHFSADRRLVDAFANDEDIHAQVASRIYGVPLDQVAPDMRYRAKAVNFGVIYGQSPFGLARELGISKDEAAKFIDSYFDNYPGIEVFLHKVLAECYRSGYVNTILGRQRAIRGVRVDGGRQRNLPERTAINTVVQGSAADLIKLAMISIHRRLRDERWPARMLLQIHDELVFEVRADQVDRLAQMVAGEMAGAKKLDVPIKVDVKVGPNWADTKRLATVG